jgi:hypothetical protein
MAKKTFNYRVFTSFTLTLAFLMLLISGIVLYISPAGRVANWTSWNIWGLSKTQWTNLHLTFMVIFIITGVLHLFYFNWKLFWSYLKTKTPAGFKFKPEMSAAIILFIVLVVGTQLKIPPMSTVAYFGEIFSESWEENQIKAPVSQAELLTVQQYAATIQEPIDNVMAVLKTNGYEANGPDHVLAELAAKYNMAPSDIDKLFKTETNEYPSGVKSSAGSGLGKLTLAGMAKQLNMTQDEALEKLKHRGVVQAKPNQTLKEIAEANGKSPQDIMTMLDPDYKK